MPRQRPPPKRSLDGVVMVGGVDYRWSVHREPLWCTEDGYWKGLAIAVEPVEAPQRQLIIEYPFPPGWKGFGTMGRRHMRPQISRSDIATRISQAMEAG